MHGMAASDARKVFVALLDGEAEGVEFGEVDVAGCDEVEARDGCVPASQIMAHVDAMRQRHVNLWA